MAKIKIKTLLNLLGVRSLEEAHDIDELARSLQKVIGERRAKDKKINLRNTEAKRDIRGILEQKKVFVSNSYSKGDLKSKLGLSDKEIRHIPATTEFGETRYLKGDIFDFMKNK